MNNNSKIQLPLPFQPPIGVEMGQPMPLQQQQQPPPPHPVPYNMAINPAAAPLAIPNIVDNKLTKQGRNRLRVRKACERCKRQKSKCDGELPCMTCVRHGHKCDYTQNQNQTTPSSISQDNSPVNANREHTSSRDENSAVPEESSSYTRYLENKVRELENYITFNNFNSDDIEEIFQKNMYTFSKDKYRVMRRYQNILPAELGNSILNSLDQSESDGLLVPRIQFYGWNMSGEHFLQQRTLPPLPQLIDFSTDSRFINWLVDFFLVKINPLFSIVHEKVFRDQLKNFLLNSKDADTSKSTRLFSAILYLIIAISLRYSEHDPHIPAEIKARNMPNLEENLFDSAYEVVDKLSFEWQSSELIQAWILITLFLRTTYRQNASYMSLGNAIRMCKGMSLNLNFVPETLDKPYEWTKSRRVFWLVYTWDRLHGFQSGKGYDIQDRTIITPFPPLSDDADDGWLSKPALAMLHLARISGEIQNFVNSNYRRDTKFIEKISGQLDNWEIWFHSNSHGFDNLLVEQVYLTYHDIVLNFNNKILFKLLEREYYSDDSHKELSTLVNHSDKVLKIFQNIDENGLLHVPWWLNLALLFHVALISVFAMNAGLFQNLSAENLKLSVEFLKKSQKHAHMAEECVWVLKTLNHMCVNRMNKSIKVFLEVGTDQGPGNVNRVKFLQFDKVDDQNPQNPKRRKVNTLAPDFIDQIIEQRFQDPSSVLFQNDGNPEIFDLNNVDGLLGNLKWFEQWVDDGR